MKQHLMKFATVAAVAAGMAFAQTPAPAPAPQPGQAATHARPRAMVRRRLMQALNLTDAQKQQAKAIFQQARQDSASIREQLKQNREALAAAVQANDSAKIQQLSNQMGTLQGQALSIRSQSMAKFYSTLTPDQQAKANQLRQKIQQRMQQRRGGNNG
jgi:Spy/CpxP family protein refolding chaperone